MNDRIGLERDASDRNSLMRMLSLIPRVGTASIAFFLREGVQGFEARENYLLNA